MDTSAQGLRVLVLVTTNEPLRVIHPAVKRPGRCVAQVEFTAFPPDEADAWLRALNDARLVLGTRLDITEDFDWDGFESTPRAPELALYAYLSWLQEQLVEAI